MEEVTKALLTYGPGGLLAILSILALVNERKERKAERTAYDAEIKTKDDALIETLTKWRLDTQMQSDKIAALVEKQAIILDAQSKRGQN